MPASDVEVVSHKKHKKSKKNKKEVEEEQVEEPQVEENGAGEQAEEENGNGHVEEEVQEEEESFQKKKKKKHSDESENGSSVDESKVSEVVKSLGEVAEELIEQFRSHAQKVIKKNKEDPALPLAAAIAILSGATKKVTRSLLTQRDVSFFNLNPN
jgi:hypothetical protein